VKGKARDLAIKERHMSSLSSKSILVANTSIEGFRNTNTSTKGVNINSTMKELDDAVKNLREFT
jgi:hypothetical protein